jgi:hypothetical protein
VTIRRSEGWLGFDSECDSITSDRGGPLPRARTRTEVVSVIWETIEPMLPDVVDADPSAAIARACRTGCVFWGIVDSGWKWSVAVATTPVSRGTGGCSMAQGWLDDGGELLP